MRLQRMLFIDRRESDRGGSSACLSSHQLPVRAATGLWLIIEAPELPAREFSPRGYAFAGVGMAIGLAFTWYVMGRIPFLP